MMTRKGPAFLALVLALTLSVSVFAQGRRNQQQQQQQQQQQLQQAQAQGVGPVPQSKDEADAFNALQKEQAPDKKVQMAEAFVAKFPTSDFLQYAHTIRLTGYSQMNNHKQAVAAAEQAIEATVKFGEK